MRRRLRPEHDPDGLAQLYAAPHQHAGWRDHRLRVATTIELCRWFEGIRSVADLSCGDATIARSLDLPTTILGDLAPGYPYQGPIEQTIEQIPSVDLFILTETLEHLDDPDRVLHAIRRKARYLVLSTPDGETDPADNPEHYWGWDVAGVDGMLRVARFEPEVQVLVNLPEYVYDFQIWACR